MTASGATATIAADRRFDDVFAALSDPTRRSIVRRLADGEATVLELAEPFPISLPAISRHLKVLEQAGLISRGRDGQRRPCRLRLEPLVEIAAWAEHTRAAWEQRLDRLEEHLRRAADGAAPPPPAAPTTSTTTANATSAATTLAATEDA